jgi:hypothetical protein
MLNKYYKNMELKNSKSFNRYKKSLILESLMEIFDSQPFKTEFTFSEDGDTITTENFLDKYGNRIRVFFHKLGGNRYESDFTFNGSSFATGEDSYSSKDYSELLNTVAKAISQFLTDFKPHSLIVEGNINDLKSIEKPNTEYQKDTVYKYFVSKIDDNEDYAIDNFGRKIILIRRRTRESDQD